MDREIIKNIPVGSGEGDKINIAFDKVNMNFEYLFDKGGAIAGTSGTSGTSGEKGPAGEKGDTGEKGPAGEKGDKGDTGTGGPAGTSGTSGVNGTSGVDGKFDLEFTTGRNIQEGDEKKFLITTGDLNIPHNSTTPFVIGTVIEGIALNDDIKISFDSGVSLLSNGNLVGLGENTAYAIVKIDTDKWVLIGSLV